MAEKVEKIIEQMLLEGKDRRAIVEELKEKEDAQKLLFYINNISKPADRKLHNKAASARGITRDQSASKYIKVFPRSKRITSNRRSLIHDLHIPSECTRLSIPALDQIY